MDSYFFKLKINNKKYFMIKILFCPTIFFQVFKVFVKNIKLKINSVKKALITDKYI